MSSTILYEKEITLNAIDSAYAKGKKEGTIEELEKVKLEIKNLYTTSVCGATPYYNAIQVDEILNKHISEVKEQYKEQED